MVTEPTEETQAQLFAVVPRDERLSDKVTSALRDAIVSGQLKPGDALPPERVLGEQFAVSRTVVREAVRSLAAKGMIEVRSGQGSRVTSVSASAVQESMALYLSAAGRTVAYDKIHEIRGLVEEQAAALAAERARAEDLAAMRTCLDAMEAAKDDLDATVRSDLDFHRSVALATHNELFGVVLDSIGDALIELRRATLGIPGRPSSVLAAHTRVFRAIEAGDPSAARAAMREHLDESRSAADHAARP